MEIAYLHVVINHLPIMGVPIVLGIWLLGWWARDDAIKRAALLGFVVLGLLTVPVFLTGKGGEDFVERVPGMSDDAIDAHEDMATLAFIAMELLAAMSLYLFLRYGGASMLRRRAPNSGAAMPAVAGAILVLVAIAASAMLGYTGRLGGKISHAEFATGAQAEANAADAAREAAEEEAEVAEGAAEEEAEAAEEAGEDDRRHRRRRGRG
jgi:signal transduction histidine kinase